MISIFYYLSAIAVSVYFGCINMVLLAMPLVGSQSARFKASAVRLSLAFIPCLIIFGILEDYRLYKTEPYLNLFDLIYLEEEPWSGFCTLLPASFILGIGIFFQFPLPVDIFMGVSFAFLEFFISHRYKPLISLLITLISIIPCITFSLLSYLFLDWFLYTKHSADCFEMQMKLYPFIMAISQSLTLMTGIMRRRLIVSPIKIASATLIYGLVVWLVSYFFLKRKSKQNAFEKYPSFASEFQKLGLDSGQAATTAADQSSGQRPRRFIEAEGIGTNLEVLRTEELFVKPLLFLSLLNSFFMVIEMPLTILQLLDKVQVDRPNLTTLAMLSSFSMIVGLASLGYRQSSALAQKWIKITPSQAFFCLFSNILMVFISSLLKYPVSIYLNLLVSLIVITLSDTMRGWRPSDTHSILYKSGLTFILLFSSMSSVVCYISIKKITIDNVPPVS